MARSSVRRMPADKIAPAPGPLSRQATPEWNRVSNAVVTRR